MLYVYLPTKMHFSNRILHGEFPEWYPFDGLGSGYFSNGFTGILHPATLLHLIFPDALALNISVVVAHFVAAMGCYYLSRYWHLSNTAAAAVSIAFTLSGYVVSMDGGNWPYLWAAAAIPWAVFGIEKNNIFFCTLAMASIAVSGERLHNLYFTSALLSVCALTHTNRRQTLISLAISGILTFLISAPQLLTTLLAAPIMSPSPEVLAEARSWALSPLRILEIFTPGFLRFPGTNDIPIHLFSQMDYNSFWADSLYIGAAVVAFCLIALYKPTQKIRERKLLVGAALIGFLFSIGTGRHAPFFEFGQRVLPGFELLRYPEKGFILPTFCLTLLSGFGIDDIICSRTALNAYPLKKKISLFRFLLIIMALGLLTTALALPDFKVGLLVMAEPAGNLKAAEAELQQILPSLQKNLLRGTAFALFALIISFGIHLKSPNLFLRENHFLPKKININFNNDITNTLSVVGIVLIPAIFCFQYSHEFWLSRELLQEQPFIIQTKAAFSDFTYGKSRLFVHDGIWQLPVPQSESYKNKFNMENNQSVSFPLYLIHSTASFFQLESVPGYFPLADGREKLAVNLLPENIFLDGMNIRFYEWSNESTFLFRRRPSAADRIRLVKAIPVKTPKEAASIVHQMDLDIATTVPVETGPLSKLTSNTNEPPLPVGGPVDASLTVIHYAPEFIEILASSATDCTLFVADSFAPGWSAAVDGTSTPIYPGLIAGRAIAFPRGQHHVVFHYRTPGLRLGLILSMTGFILLGILVVLRARKGKIKIFLTKSPP